jgi:hypothetical protein
MGPSSTTLYSQNCIVSSLVDITHTHTHTHTPHYIINICITYLSYSDANDNTNSIDIAASRLAQPVIRIPDYIESLDYFPTLPY